MLIDEKRLESIELLFLDSPSGIGFAFHGVKINRILWMGWVFSQPPASFLGVACLCEPEAGPSGLSPNGMKLRSLLSLKFIILR